MLRWTAEETHANELGQRLVLVEEVLVHVGECHFTSVSARVGRRLHGLEDE